MTQLVGLLIIIKRLNKMVQKYIKIALSSFIACQNSMIGAAEASYVSEYAKFGRSKNMMLAR